MHKKIKRIYQFLLTLLSIVCLTIACETILAKTYLLSSDHWIKTSQESMYTSYLTNSINQSIQDTGLASGIKKDGLNNVISEEQVQQNLNQFVGSAFQGKAYETNNENIKKELYSAIETYAKKENMTINETNKVYVDKLVEQSVQLYDNQINNKIVSTIGLRVKLIKRLVDLLVISTSVLFFVLIVLLYFASDRYKHVFIRNLAYIITTTGLLLVSITAVITIKNPVAFVSLFDAGMKEWINTSLALPMKIQKIMSGVFLAMGILLSIYSYTEYKRLEQRGFRRKEHSDEENEDVDGLSEFDDEEINPTF